MKHIATLVLALFVLAPAAQADSLCSQKEQNIKRQLRYAEQHHNMYRVEGLKRALSKVQTYCTDSKLMAEHQKDVIDKKAKVAKRQADLDQARLKGDPEKIAKRERKLAKAQAELKELENRLY